MDSKHILGEPCTSAKHPEGADVVLKYKRNGSCVACHRNAVRKSTEVHMEHKLQQVKRWAQANPDKVRAYVRKSSAKWREANPVRYREKALKFNRQRAGMVNPHGRREGIGQPCPICKTTMTDKGSRRAVLDHDHVTGQIREPVCNSCNSRVLHLFEPGNALAAAAQAYITKHAQAVS